MENPYLLILGGANGSGKTTVAREFAALKNLPYLGADEIAAKIDSTDPASVAIEAGREFVNRIASFLDEKVSFILESTLSGKSLRRWVEKAVKNGYTVEIIFVYLDSPELCIQRVKERVAKGGHHVPEADIVRRWERSNLNFWRSYSRLAHRWTLVNNDETYGIQIATYDSQTVLILDEERFEKWTKMVTR